MSFIWRRRKGTRCRKNSQPQVEFFDPCVSKRRKEGTAPVSKSGGRSSKAAPVAEVEVANTASPNTESSGHGSVS
jgi:hypothetical protein